jgi:hypothetical protein
MARVSKLPTPWRLRLRITTLRNPSSFANLIHPHFENASYPETLKAPREIAGFVVRGDFEERPNRVARDLLSPSTLLQQRGLISSDSRRTQRRPASCAWTLRRPNSLRATKLTKGPPSRTFPACLPGLRSDIQVFNGHLQYASRLRSCVIARFASICKDFYMQHRPAVPTQSIDPLTTGLDY